MDAIYIAACASTLETSDAYDGRSKTPSGGSMTSAPRAPYYCERYHDVTMCNIPMTIVGLFGSFKSPPPAGSTITLTPPTSGKPKVT
jgi:hypothetical protein